MIVIRAFKISGAYACYLVQQRPAVCVCVASVYALAVQCVRLLRSS